MGMLKCRAAIGLIFFSSFEIIHRLGEQYAIKHVKYERKNAKLSVFDGIKSYKTIAGHGAGYGNTKQ